MGSQEEQDALLIKSIAPHMQQLRDIKDLKEFLAKEVKDVNEQEAYLENIIITRLRGEGLDSIKINGVASASVGEEVYYSIEDYDAARDYIVEHKLWEFLNKSFKASALREADHQGHLPPGIKKSEPIPKLSFRRINK